MARGNEIAERRGGELKREDIAMQRKMSTDSQEETAVVEREFRRRKTTKRFGLVETLRLH